MSAAAEAPWTVLRLLRWTEGYFRERGLEPARRQAEDLLGAVLDLDRLHLYLHFEDAPTPSELALFRERVRRRAAGEPLQHILGSQPFLELTLKADRRALIPRPETEELARRLRQWLADRPHPWTVADVCTGGGCLALALAAQAGEGDRVWASDSSGEALGQARENAEALGLAGRVVFLQGDLCAPLAGLPPLDLLCANPPYIPSGDIASLQPEVRDHEPRMALDGGATGLELPRRLLGQAAAALKPGGLLAMELGLGQGEALAAEAAGSGAWDGARAEKDFSGRFRYLMAVKR